LIDTLRADGYQFASLGQLIGIGRDQLMPPDTGLRARFDGFSFGLIQAVRQGIAWVFWFVVIVGTARSAVFLALPLLRRRPQDGPGEFRPPVTVLVPAYNEEDVIQRNMQAVLDSAYDDLRIVVIDDGSTDGTLARLNEAYGNDPRVTILSEPNRGKWLALDRAYDEVTTDFVIAIDADTLIAPDAIAKLVAHFRDPKVGAVAGNVRVGNRQNLLTALQSLEYVTAQNIDRRAAEVFDGVMVVPGAIGAWRVDAVRKVGLYSNQTLTEDADLTVSVLRLGYHVVFEEHAYSVTEVPATIRGFLLQRLRWSLGMMQTAWKHRGAASEGRAIGLITIPDLFLFGVVMPLLAPLADLLFLGTLIDFLVNILTGQTGLIDRAAVQVLLGYLALPAMDFFKAALALHYEKTERWTLLLVQPFQRILYQPLLYLSALRALFRAIDGKPTPWTKLVHRGTAMSPRA
jgi:cellulose synthase/poly-beta-1,6-N-acetylglucosamine synthase-like glycosyltransferase